MNHWCHLGPGWSWLLFQSFSNCFKGPSLLWKDSLKLVTKCKSTFPLISCSVSNLLSFLSRLSFHSLSDDQGNDPRSDLSTGTDARSLGIRPPWLDLCGTPPKHLRYVLIRFPFQFATQIGIPFEKMGATICWLHYFSRPSTITSSFRVLVWELRSSSPPWQIGCAIGLRVFSSLQLLITWVKVLTVGKWPTAMCFAVLINLNRLYLIVFN